MKLIIDATFLSTTQYQVTITDEHGAAFISTVTANTPIAAMAMALDYHEEQNAARQFPPAPEA